MTTPWLITAQVLLDSGLEHVSTRNATLAGIAVEGRVLDWGRVSKTISPFSAGPQTADAVFRMADTDHRWRDLILTQSFRGRTVRLRQAIADDDSFAADPFWIGEIVETSFGQGWIEITARDNSWAWMDEFVPPLLTSANFPYILPSTEGAFSKIIFGNVDDVSVDGDRVGADRFGAVPLNHLGPVGDIDRWNIARHRIYDIEVYRRTSASPDFAAVDPSEYTVTVEELNVDGYIYELSHLDFLAVQDSGAVITANIRGLYFRPAFGSYPAVGYDPDLNPTGVPGELYNPIDACLNFFRLDCRKVTQFDYAGTIAIRTKFESLAFKCSGVIDSSDSRRAILSRLLPNFNLDLFHNRAGELALNFTDSTTASLPLYSDRVADGGRHLILRESFMESDPNPVANRCILPASRHYASNAWLWTGTYDNSADQAIAAVPERDAADALILVDGVAVRDSRIVSTTAEFWFCRDAATIYSIATRRMAFMALNSFQQTFDLPMPEVLDEIELCRQVLVTNRFGLAVGGYSRVEVKIFGVAMDLKRFVTTLSTIRRVPGTVLIEDPELIPVVVFSGSVTIAAESELAPTVSGYEFVSSTSASSPDTHSATTPTIDTTDAGLLVAAVADYIFSGFSTVSDNYGNTWQTSPPTKYTETDDFGDLAAVQIWFCIPTAVGPLHAFTVTNILPAFPSQPSIAVAVFRGTPNATPFDAENGSFSGSADSLQPGSVTPSEDRELIITALASDSVRPTISMSIDGGFTIVENQTQTPSAYGVALAYLIQESAAAADPTWDTGVVTGGALTASIATFKAA